MNKMCVPMATVCNCTFQQTEVLRMAQLCYDLSCNLPFWRVLRRQEPQGLKEVTMLHFMVGVGAGDHMSGSAAHLDASAYINGRHVRSSSKFKTG